MYNFIIHECTRPSFLFLMTILSFYFTTLNNIMNNDHNKTNNNRSLNNNDNSERLIFFLSYHIIFLNEIKNSISTIVRNCSCIPIYI